MAISLISWNCHGYRAHLEDLKTLVNSVHPICVGLQETMLSPLIQTKLKHYNIIRKDNIHDARPIGGVALLYSQATAIQINIRTQFTLCSLYLPPKQIIRPSDFDDLVDQVPAPFIIFGDWKLYGVAPTPIVE
ncbi:putative RNA-directed DNA polymerase from transposon X-element, partial [Caerostris extrusa]